MKKMLIVFVAILMFGCVTKSDIPERDSVACKVTALSVLHEDPVCVVECSWTRPYYGYANSVVVPCSWQGKTVSRN